MSAKTESASQRGESDGEVGRLVDCSQADDRRLIQLVRERRLLYARNNMPVASYYNQVKRLWLEVANKMGWSGTYLLTCDCYNAVVVDDVVDGKQTSVSVSAPPEDLLRRPFGFWLDRHFEANLSFYVFFFFME